jgi:hypothetical protein
MQYKLFQLFLRISQFFKINTLYVIHSLSEVLEKLDGKPAYHLDTFKMAVANIIAGIVYGSRYVPAIIV